MTQPLAVVGIGNALVDVIATADDAFLDRELLVKGSMSLVDAERAESLYAAMGPAVEMSGGSAANTMAGIASLGGRGAFLGRVRDDQLGTVFAHDIRAVGVEYPCEPAHAGPPTGRSLIIVTPDAQRTMSTYLGSSSELGPGDVDEDVVARAQITYLEGYLFDRDAAKEAFEKAAAVAHSAGARVALTLSDSFCVQRFAREFRELVAGDVDILFANEDELAMLYETDVDRALAEAESTCEIVALTRSAAGCTIAAGGERHDVPAHQVPRVVDTTGAGDLFAAGFLHGMTIGKDLVTAARIGSLAAAEVISHLGARPETDLAELAAALLDEA
ncbi:MAG: adenosine kinase [Acidimicrobiales bacterium]